MKPMSNHGILRKWRVWLKDQFIGDVPPEDDFCEFECDKTQCSLDPWEHCEGRLAYINLAKARSTDGSSPAKLADL
jgi:hypothetical protein